MNDETWIAEKATIGDIPSSEFMRLCLDAAPIGIAVFDREMRYLAANRRFLADHRKSEAGLIGRSHYEVYPEIPARWREIHRRCLGGATERCDADAFVHGDGSTQYLRWEMRPWHERDGRIGGVLLFSDDVTAQVVGNSDRIQWADAFENAAFPIAIGDPDNNTVRFANAAFAAMRQMSVAEMNGMPIREVYAPEEWSRVVHFIRQADATGHVVFESVLVRKDGSRFPALMDITSVHRADGRRYRISTARDITDRNRADSELQASEARYRRLLDSIHDGVFIAQNEKLIFYNRRLLEMIGVDKPGLDDPSFPAVIHPDQYEVFRDRFRNRVTGKTPPRHYETALRHQVTGKPVAVMLHATRIDHDGAPAVLGTVADISERRKIEDQLRQATKMEAVGQLTGGVAHDFNNLLTVVIGNLDLASSLIEGHPAAALVGNALKGAQRGADLVQKMLAFARKQTLKPQQLEMQRVVADMDDMLRRSLGETIEIETKIHGTPAAVRCDKTHLETSLLNLAINARDAMPQGGKLTIEVANASLDETYASMNPDVNAGDYVMLSVSDTGGGMSPEVLAHVVEPFFTTKEAGKGSGLGLSMIYGFVRQSLGHLKIYSEVGNGTTVRLYLPRADADATDAVVAPAPTVVAAPGSERILVVEDDAMVRDLVVMQLGALGYQVQTAGNGPEALKKMQDGEVFDLLFTDMMMPGGMTGSALAAEARKYCPQISILFTSGYTEDAILRRGDLSGAFDFLPKPYMRKTLAAKLRELLDRRKPA